MLNQVLYYFSQTSHNPHLIASHVCRRGERVRSCSRGTLDTADPVVHSISLSLSTGIDCDNFCSKSNFSDSSKLVCCLSCLFSLTRHLFYGHKTIRTSMCVNNYHPLYIIPDLLVELVSSPIQLHTVSSCLLQFELQPYSSFSCCSDRNISIYSYIYKSLTSSLSFPFLSSPHCVFSCEH